MFFTARSLRLLPFAFLALAMSCAIAPRMRAPLDPPTNRPIEMGAAVVTLLDGGLTPGAGATAWLQAAVSPQLDLFAQAAAIARVDGAYAGHHLDLQLGLRLRQPILHDTWVAVEGAVLYEQRDINPNELRPHLTFVGRGPLAQQFPGLPLFLYAAPTMTLTIPLYDDPLVPFFGYSECPLGLVWRVDDGLAIYFEGGLWSVLGGGYASAGAAVLF